MNKGKLRLTVQLKGLFLRKQQQAPTTPTGSSGSPSSTRRTLENANSPSPATRRTLENASSSTPATRRTLENMVVPPTKESGSVRKTRKSIFRADGTPNDVAVRPKGRKSIFWG